MCVYSADDLLLGAGLTLGQVVCQFFFFQHNFAVFCMSEGSCINHSVEYLHENPHAPVIMSNHVFLKCFTTIMLFTQVAQAVLNFTEASHLLCCSSPGSSDTFPVLLSKATSPEATPTGSPPRRQLMSINFIALAKAQSKLCSSPHMESILLC